MTTQSVDTQNQIITTIAMKTTCDSKSLVQSAMASNKISIVPMSKSNNEKDTTTLHLIKSVGKNMQTAIVNLKLIVVLNSTKQ